MYCTVLSPTVCRVAYVLADHLNRATGDCWPAQSTIARKIGVSVKTIQRSVRRLEEMGLLAIKRSSWRGETHRYVPVYQSASEADHGVPTRRQSWAKRPDANDQQFYLRNQHRTDLADRQGWQRRSRATPDRGRIEVEIAQRLGADGFDVLNRLAEIDDEFVARLCDRHRLGLLTDEDLNAVRLAAKQVRR